MKTLLKLSVAVVLLLLASGGYLGGTQSGFRILADIVEGVGGGSIRVKSVSGTLFSSWTVHGLDIRSSAADISLFEASGSWQPGNLLVRRLDIVELTAQGVRVRLREQQENDQIATGDHRLELPQFDTPISLMASSVKIRNLSVWGSDGAELVNLDQLFFELAVDRSSVRLIDFVAAAPNIGVEMAGRLDSAGGWDIDLAGNVSYLDENLPLVYTNFSITGSAASVEVAVWTQSPAPVRFEATVEDLQGEQRWHSQLVIEDFHVGRFFEEVIEVKVDALLASSGTGLSHETEVRLTAETNEFGETELDALISGDEHGLSIKESTVTGDAGHAAIGADLSWNDGLKWDLRVDLENLSIDRLLPEADGLFQAGLHSQGSYRSGKDLSAEITLQGLKGTLAGRNLQGAARMSVSNREISVTEALLTSGASTLAARGKLGVNHDLWNWDNRFQWEGQLQGYSLDPSLINPAYYGDVDVRMTSRGSHQGETFVAYLEIGELSGTVRDFPIHGRGTASLRDDSLVVDDLSLGSGKSTLDISGAVDEELDLAFALVSPDIGEVVEGASGTLSLTGSLTGQQDDPRADLTLAVRELVFDALRFDRLDGSIAAGATPDSDIDAQLSVTEIEVAGQAIERVDLAVNGTIANHGFTADLASPEAALALSVKGGLGEGGRWSGVAEKFEVTTPALGSWTNSGSGSLGVSASHFELQELCFAMDDQSFCLSGGWDKLTEQWAVDLSWEQYDLSALSTLESMPIEIQGVTSGRVRGAGDLERVESAEANVEIDGGGIGEDGTMGEWQLPRLDDIVVMVNLEAEKFTGKLDATFVDGSIIDSQLKVDEVGSFGGRYLTLPIEGYLRLDAENLDFVAPLTNDYVYPSGSVEGVLNLQGYLFDPVAEGKLDLRGGSIDFPTFGVVLEDVIFRVFAMDNVLQLWGEGVSGEGRLYADGSLRFEADDVEGEFNFTGENIDTLRLPEYEIRTTPDLRLVFDTDGGNLVGQLYVPHAVIAPEYITGTLSESSDVVFLDGDEVKPAGGWQFNTAIDVSLGEDVWLDGYGLTGYLRGDITVAKHPGVDVTASGELSLAEGMFTIYGRSLDIVRGRVFFGGGPIEFPEVDVRAQKVVSDQRITANRIEVGVDVSGPVDDLEFKMFSEPFMEDSDILAYMIVGRSRSETGNTDENILNSAAMALGMEGNNSIIQNFTSLLPVDDIFLEGETSGEGFSLVVGRNITDELFVGYDHNFFDQQGEMTIRYELGRGFFIESRTSAEGTGADLLFSFER